MKVLVDTCIWSLALRRREPDGHPAVSLFAELIRECRVQMIGAIRQEILSGIKGASQFAMLKERLKAFDDLPLQAEDYELAAEFFNVCRARGVQGSNSDFLICAVSVRHELPILTTDKDFSLFREHVPIKLISV